jgi:hypothetical protein
MQRLRALANVSNKAAQRDCHHQSFVSFVILPVAVLHSSTLLIDFAARGLMD